MRGTLPRRLALHLVLLGALGLAAVRLEATLPAGFTDTLVTPVSGPTALAFTPDGRLLLTQQTGALRVFQSGALLATPALSFAATDLCSNSERGLLGVAVDPGFAANHFIYLYYTFNKFHNTCPANTAQSPVNRVSRFTLPDTNVISAASELVLLDNMPSPNGNHNGGDLKFGNDGNLYATIGDGGCDYAGDSGCGGANDASRDENVLTGKVMRITPDGGIPATNPFQGAGTARCNTGATMAGNRCQETFAWGLRNPFRLAMDPNTGATRFFINDVGQSAWEEIDLGGFGAVAGADYGWVCREGRHVNSSTGKCSPAPAGTVDPIFEYAHGATLPGTSQSNCNAITGGAFVPNGLWPGFDGVYLFSDFICGGVFQLANSGGPYVASDFATGLGGSSAVDLVFGPSGASQALYYTTYAAGGQVRRIDFSPPPLRLQTLPPCRLVDTRGAAGPLGGPALASGATRTFPGTGACGIPATARALVANVTVVAPPGAGFLQLFPGGTPIPGSSNLNFAAGQTRTNNAVLPLGAAGDLAARPSFPGGGGAHLVIDVSGWFE